MLTKEEAKLRNSILGALRRCFSRSYLRREALEKARHKHKRGPRGGKVYTCNVCNNVFPQSSVQVDHIRPVIPVNLSLLDLSWDFIIDRLFCKTENLQVLCKKCHNKKTRDERKQRSEAKRNAENSNSV